MLKKPLLAALLIIAGCGTTQENRELAGLHLQIGTGHLNNGNYPTALSELLIAEKLDPDNPFIQNNLGLTYFFRGRNDLARAHIEKALKLAPSYTDARNNLGRVYIEEKKYGEAVTELKKVTTDLTYPSPEKGHLNLGLAYFYQKKYQLALQQFSKAMDLNKSFCLAYNYYGRTLFEQREYNKAAASLDQAVHICKGSGFDEPHYYSGLSYWHLGDRDRAVSRMKELIELYPSGKYMAKAKVKIEKIK